MSDSARHPAVEMFLTLASPAISSEENPKEHRKSTRCARLTLLSLFAMGRSVVLVRATGSVGMDFGLRP
jgi:hypothetical protein